MILVIVFLSYFLSFFLKPVVLRLLLVFLQLYYVLLTLAGATDDAEVLFRPFLLQTVFTDVLPRVRTMRGCVDCR